MLLFWRHGRTSWSFALPIAAFTERTPEEAGGRDPELGEGWERSAVFTPPPPPPPPTPCSLSLLRQLFNWFHLWKGPFMVFKWPSVFIERNETRDACVKCIIIQCGKMKLLKERPAICILDVMNMSEGTVVDFSNLQNQTSPFLYAPLSRLLEHTSGLCSPLTLQRA